MFRIILIYLSFFSWMTTAAQENLDGSEFLINSTIQIQCKVVVSGKYRTTSGTGFFFTYNWKDGNTIPVLVTNKHVVKGAREGVMYFKEWESPAHPLYGQTIKVNFLDFEKLWILHPDTSVDLAVLPFTDIEKYLNTQSKRKFQYPTFNESNLLNDSIAKTVTAIEEVYMIGYPYGLRDEANDTPVVRRGTTATPLFLNYKNKTQFLIDMPVYRGSSGSPVLVYNSQSYSTRSGETVFGKRMILVGINFATYNKSFDGKLVPRKTDSIDSLQLQTSLPLYNIGIVIKAQRLLDFKKVFAEMEKNQQKKP